jgi:hypothetical protein
VISSYQETDIIVNSIWTIVGSNFGYLFSRYNNTNMLYLVWQWRSMQLLKSLTRLCGSVVNIQYCQYTCWKGKSPIIDICTVPLEMMYVTSCMCSCAHATVYRASMMNPKFISASRTIYVMYNRIYILDCIVVHVMQ